MAPKNSKAGHKTPKGYIQIRVDGRLYFAARLAFLWMEGYFPEHEAEHIDRDRENNSWRNLREASRVCNMRNLGKHGRNTSGVVGVSWDNEKKKWRADIRVYGKLQRLGRFNKKIDAVSARWSGEKKYGFADCNKTSSAYEYLKQHGVVKTNG